MTRKLPEEFEGKELAPLCIAANLSEAKTIEKVLDEENIDYTFEITPFLGGILTGIKDGVMFLVYSDQLHFCQHVLKKAGLSKHLIDG